MSITWRKNMNLSCSKSSTAQSSGKQIHTWKTHRKRTFNFICIQNSHPSSTSTSLNVLFYTLSSNFALRAEQCVENKPLCFSDLTYLWPNPGMSACRRDLPFILRDVFNVTGNVFFNVFVETKWRITVVLCQIKDNMAHLTLLEI